MSQYGQASQGGPGEQPNYGDDPFAPPPNPQSQPSPYGDPQTQPSPYGDPQSQGSPYADPQSQPSPYANPAPYGQDTQYGSPYGQQPYGAAGYGYQQPPGYGMAQAQYGYGAQPQGEHPQATTVLVLGILGFFVPFVSFAAWYIGGKAKKEVDAGAPYRFDGGIKIGYLLGKILSIISIVGTVLFILLMLFGMGAMMVA